MRHHVSALTRGESGQSLLETAMMITIIFAVVFWMFEIGWLMYTYSVMANAANEGVRYSIVHSGGDAAGTEATVKNFATASLHDVTAITTSITFPDGSAAPPNRVRVAVTYVYIPYLPRFISAPTMRTYAEGRMVVQ
jgi:Flp pilus assembly protein TadG